jgi:hypothetical protein
VKGQEQKVCKLIKSLYGLKQIGELLNKFGMAKFNRVSTPME